MPEVTITESADFLIDVAKPLELEDGTPCLFLGTASDGSEVRVCILSEPTGHYPRSAHLHDYGWWHHTIDGSFIGCEAEGYLRLRNVAANAAAEPAEPVAPMVRFEVRAGLNGSNRDLWSSVRDFDNGKDAGAWVADNRAMYAEAGKSLAIVRVELAAAAAAEVEDWRERERKRFASGEYQPLPNQWQAEIDAAYPDHFAHVSQGDKRKVAFTETESAGQRDRQKVLSAAAYMDRFFNGSTGAFYGETSRAAFVADMLGESIKPLFLPLGDADAMQSFYRQTDGGDCHGCMSHNKSDYSSPIHPVRVYAMGGELTIAFLLYDDAGREVDLDADSWETFSNRSIAARCLVWPEAKQYGRVYGQTSNARMLKTALEAQGYKAGRFYGAKVAKVPHHGGYVMPYLDVADGWATDTGDDKFLELGELPVGVVLHCNNTNGLVDAVEMIECEHCGDTVEQDSSYTVATGRYDYETWCCDCAGSHAFTCSISGELTSDDYLESYIPSGRSYEQNASSWALSDSDAALCSDGVYREDYFVCASCNDVFADDDIAGEDDEGDSLCSCCHDAHVEAKAAEAEAEAEADTAQAA